MGQKDKKLAINAMRDTFAVPPLYVVRSFGIFVNPLFNDYRSPKLKLTPTALSICTMILHTSYLYLHRKIEKEINIGLAFTLFCKK